MVFIHFELFWVFRKLSVEKKTNVNNSNSYHAILQGKKFVGFYSF